MSFSNQAGSLDGDSSFIGVNEVGDPASLPPGYYSRGKNKRVHLGELRDRGGHIRTAITNESGDGYTPTAHGTTYGSVDYVTEPGKRCVLIFGENNAWLDTFGEISRVVNYPAGVTITGDVQAIQCDTEVRVARGASLPCLVWTGSGDFSEVDTSAAPEGYVRMPNSIFLLYFYSRVWAYDGDSVWPSVTGSFDLYDAANKIEIDPGANDSGVGLQVYNQSSIVVTKKNSAYAITGIDATLDYINLEKLSDNVGSEAALAPVVDGGEMFLPTSYGIFPISQAFESRLRATSQSMSLPIGKTYSNMNFSKFGGIVGTVHDGYYLWAFPSSGSATNDRVLVYSIENKAWCGFDEMGPGYHVKRWSKLNVGGRLELVAITPDGYAYLYGKDELLAEFSGTDQDNATETEWVSRGFCGSIGARGDTSFGDIELRIRTINPKYSIFSQTDGVNEVQTEVTDKTKDPTKYTVMGRDDYVASNINLDFDNPYREDYSIISSETDGFYLDSLTSGETNVVYGQLQDFKHRVRVFRRGRYVQIKVTNKRGHLQIVSCSTSANGTAAVFLQNQTT